MKNSGNKLTVLVTGSRRFSDPGAVFTTLDSIRPDEIIVGDARGADAIARAWATRRGVPLVVFAADWEQFGRAAGHIRNVQMVETLSRRAEAGAEVAAVAFYPVPGIEHRGTQGAVRLLREIGCPISEITQDETTACDKN